MDGNEACARIAYLFTEVAGIYPITPSSPMAELIDEWASQGMLNLFNSKVKVVEMQSEAGAAGLVHGILQSGCLATTFTASQGLLLKIPNMYKIAGELLPGVIHVAARSLSTHALSILGDHQDIYATRMTGFTIIASSNVQEAMDLAAISHLSAIKSSLPVLHFFDGFRTSHELQKIELLSKEELEPLLDKDALKRFRKRGLSPLNKVIRGTTHNEDIYFQATEVRNKDHNQVPDIVNNYMKELEKVTGRLYKPFVYYGHKEATDIIIAMGSVCETIKETVDYLNRYGEKVGLIEVHLYRPFSNKYFFDVLPSTVERIAVIDRTKEAGSNGEPLYLDIVSAFSKVKDQPYIIGGRYGLSGKDVTPIDIRSIYHFLRSRDSFTSFTVGIVDDVTNLSIPLVDFNMDLHHVMEFLIYGYGSDGMISCSKDIIKVIGDYTKAYVQGYFQYDSKKSGGLTRSHIRLSLEPIRSTYYIYNPSLVVCSKEAYLGRYEMLFNIRNNGIFLFVTSSSEEEVKKLLEDKLKRLLAVKNIEFYIIDAYALANECGLKNKISMVLETAIFKITNLLDFNLAKNIIKKNIINNFAAKGPDVIRANLSVVDQVEKYLKRVKVDPQWKELKVSLKKEEEKVNKVFHLMENLKGNELAVSDFLPYKDGSYIIGTTQYEKRKIAENVPIWLPENCIQCNQCAFACPHAVIRPYLLTEKEYNEAPDKVKEESLKALGSNYQFQIGISTFDCTGCGVCVNVCPGKDGKKALTMEPFKEEEGNESFEYLENKVLVKEEMIKSNVRGSQFQKPAFEFSGACAGCGETPYLKLLTQSFKDNLMIANATGCSSIYGASMPSMPYSVPWANSLFEDNAEYGYGMVIAYNTLRSRIKGLMEEGLKNSSNNKDLYEKWLNNYDDYKITKEVYDNLDYSKELELLELKEFIPTRNIWIIGGDGWAYDIGFSGIDHLLSSNDNVNILILDTEVYSNTGGQSSKASPKGSIAKFTTSGKDVPSKDLARIAMTYPNVYVAQVSMGANMHQTLKAFEEAANHEGPSIIIAYSTCILQGIKKGMEFSQEQQKRAVKCGYFPIFRYNAKENKFTLDFKEPDFSLYEEFLNSENRFAMLQYLNEENADRLFKESKEEAEKRFNYYKNLM